MLVDFRTLCLIPPTRPLPSSPSPSVSLFHSLSIYLSVVHPFCFLVCMRARAHLCVGVGRRGAFLYCIKSNRLHKYMHSGCGGGLPLRMQCSGITQGCREPSNRFRLQSTHTNRLYSLERNFYAFMYIPKRGNYNKVHRKAADTSTTLALVFRLPHTYTNVFTNPFSLFSLIFVILSK